MQKQIPVAPNGWPRAIAPPLTLTFVGSSSNFLQQYTYWDAKACEQEQTNVIWQLYCYREEELENTDETIPHWFQKGQYHWFVVRQLSQLQGLQQLAQYPLQLDQLQLPQSSYICTLSYNDGPLNRNLQLLKVCHRPLFWLTKCWITRLCSVKLRCLNVFVPHRAHWRGTVMIPKDANNWKALFHSDITSH